jgi:AcrR family transcriptional regulator
LPLRRTAHKPGKPTRGRQAQKEATRARILEVARSHFERDGFADANIRAIAVEAGVAPGTILLHFTDKLGLLHAALHDDLELAIARSLSTPSRGPLLRRLGAVVRPFYAYYAARPRLSRALLKESLLAESPWRERFAAQLMHVNAHVIVLLDEAKAHGEISRATPAALFAAAFSAFYYIALIGWVQGGLADPLSLFKRLMKQHIKGCGASRARAAADSPRQRAG